MARTAVIAAGEEHLARVGRSVASLRRSGWQVIVVPGHATELHNLEIQQLQAASEVPAQPPCSLIAMAQGQVGSALALALRHLGMPVVAAVTHVLSEARRVVEAPAVRALVDAGYVVVAGGGGGVPVGGSGTALNLDTAAELLATTIGADALVLVTGESPADAHLLTVAEAEQRQAAGQFPGGPLGAKVDTAIRFVHGGGALAAITTPELVLATVEGTASPLEGETGILIVGPDRAL